METFLNTNYMMNSVILFNIADSKLKKYDLNGNTSLTLYEDKVRLAKKNELGISESEYKNYIQKTKLNISLIEDVIPLYDIVTKKIFMINKDKIYSRIKKDNYRFIDSSLLKSLSQQQQEFMESNFDLHILEQTFYKIYYKYNKETGKEITLCIKPSFIPIFPHLRPYYTRSEIINLALNMELIKPNKIYYNEQQINKLCKMIIKNDIGYEVLLKHRQHIIDTDNVNLIQYYSLNGSYFMNRYLRNVSNNIIRNEIMERNSIELWKVILSAPAFDSDYTVYRFIDNDSFLSKLDIGSIFVDKGFISTTRDPFYRNDKYKFGFTLIKINLPKNKKGVGLAVDTFSNFPEEQEIILPPYAKLKLINKDTDCKFYHIDNDFESKIIRKYQFEFVGNTDSKDFDPSNYTTIEFDNTPLDLSKILLKSENLLDKIKEFQKKYTNEINQFSVIINDIHFTLLTEWYDSTVAYKGFYAIENKNGFSIYCFHKNKILFVLEIMELLHELHVNYYFRHSENSTIFSVISEQSFILFLCQLSFVFNIQRVIIYGNYNFCFRVGDKPGSYRVDFVDYLRNKKKRFIDMPEVEAKFDYMQLDSLYHTNPDKILKKSDSDSLHSLWISNKINNLAEFYLFIIDNHCNLIGILENKMKRLFTGLSVYSNPFLFDYYSVSPQLYLYNRKYISYLPDIDMIIEESVFDPLSKQENSRNRYRND